MEDAILNLPGLQYGGQMSADAIAADTGLSAQEVRDPVWHLIMPDRLRRIPGIASRPAHYRLTNEQDINWRASA